MAFFYRHNPKKFNYIPRYYDPEQQAWEEKKAAAGLDSKLTHEEQLRIKMRQKWGTGKGSEESKAEQRNKLIRRIVLGVFILFVFYFIFCTPVLNNIVGGLMGK